jgi:hypothetical protein
MGQEMKMSASIVMPYWDRPDALYKTLSNYEVLYLNMELEIIIVDDGSIYPPRLPPGIEDVFKVKVITLQKKVEALNPCVPINAGVRVATKEYIILTNPEILHDRHILEPLIKTVLSTGPVTYVAAACWSTDTNKWLCHSSLTPTVNKSMGRAAIPPNAGLHFCAALRKSTFEKAGGFNEEYRSGAGYEDNDFLWRLYEIGTVFKIRDDLVTHHSKSYTKWPQNGHLKNKTLFNKLWNNKLKTWGYVNE